MRDFLTGLAIILIVVLTTILVAPYFVDWNGQRGFLEARLSMALGQKVTIGGNIDLKLLPTPYLVLDQVVVGGDDAAMRVGVRHLNLELAVTPLLHGEFDIVEARLREPTIRINLEKDRTLPALPAAPAFSADVRFDRIEVSSGTLAVSDQESGRTFVLDNIDLDADAGSFAGPFKVSGTTGSQAHRNRFRLTTTAIDKGRAHAKLTIDETKEHPALDLDGNLDLRDQRGGRLRQKFDGVLAVNGRMPMTGDPIVWRLTGPLKLDPVHAAIEGGELRLGGDTGGLTLQVDARADLGETPKLAIDLKGKQLDIDRLAGLPAEGEKPPPPKLPDLATLRRLASDLAPPLPTGLDVSVDTATYGGETLSGIELHLGLGDAAKRSLRFAIDGPGGAHVAGDGTLDMTAGDAFAGTLDLGADNLPRTLDWLAQVAPAMSWSGRDLPFKSVKLAGHVTAGKDAIDATGLTVSLDRSALSGAARLTLGDAAHSAKLKADLTASALDLDGLPSFDVLRGSQPLDLDLRLDARALKVSRVGEGALDAGHIQVAVTKTGSRVAIEKLRVNDLGGASIDATGHLDRQGGQFAVTLDATHLEAAAGLAKRLVPGPATDALVARAPALAPTKLQFDLTVASDAKGLSPRTLSITGTAGKTKVYAEAKPENGGTTITGSLDAPEGSTLLRQLGVPTVPIETIGAGRVTLSATRQGDKPYETTLAAAFGTTTIDVTGNFTPTLSTLGGSGRLTLRSSDLSPLVQAAAIAFPDLTGRLPADVTSPIAIDKDAVALGALKGKIAAVGVRGALRWQRPSGDGPSLTGTLDSDHLTLSSLLGLALGQPQPTVEGAPWSKQPFAPGLIEPPRVALHLATPSLGLLPGIEARNATLDLTVGPGVVGVDKLAAEVLGGHAEGGGLLRRDGRQATLEARLALKSVAVHVPGAFDTKLDARLDLAGSGTSAASLVASLAGSGDTTTSAFSVERADPAAVAKVFDDVEDDTISADPDATMRDFADHARQPIALGPQHYAVSIASGIAHFVPKDRPSRESSGVAGKIGGALDLGRFRIEARVEETLERLPKNWSGPAPTVVIDYAGPIGRPERTIDMSGFSNALTARAVAREGARIEAGALDVRERALFSTRLKFEQRREEERQKAEDDARKAEAERKARLEAARQERLRREQAKRDKERQEREDAEKGAQPDDTPNQDRPPPQGRSEASPPQPAPGNN